MPVPLVVGAAIAGASTVAGAVAASAWEIAGYAASGAVIGGGSYYVGKKVYERYSDELYHQSKRECVAAFREGGIEGVAEWLMDTRQAKTYKKALKVAKRLDKEHKFSEGERRQSKRSRKARALVAEVAKEEALAKAAAQQPSSAGTNPDEIFGVLTDPANWERVKPLVDRFVRESKRAQAEAQRPIDTAAESVAT